MVAKECDVKKVSLTPEDLHIKVLLCINLDHDLEQDLTKFLKDTKSTFV